MPPGVEIDVHGRSELGSGRSLDGDRFLVAELGKSLLVDHTNLPVAEKTRLVGTTQSQLCVVADGTGDIDAGYDASAVAVETVTRHVLDTMPWFYRLDCRHEEDLRGELAATLRRCKEALLAELGGGAALPERLGATLTMAYLLWPNMYVLHVGDGRCSVHRRRELRQVTTDHTVVELLSQGGSAVDGQADPWLGRPLWNVIDTKQHSTAVPEVRKVRLEEGDIAILATGGLAAGEERSTIAAILETATSASEATRSLVHAAKAAGSRDDVTVVVARFGPRRDP